MARKYSSSRRGARSSYRSAKRPARRSAYGSRGASRASVRRSGGQRAYRDIRLVIQTTPGTGTPTPPSPTTGGPRKRQF